MAEVLVRGGLGGRGWVFKGDNLSFLQTSLAKTTLKTLIRIAVGFKAAKLMIPLLTVRLIITSVAAKMKASVGGILFFFFFFLIWEGHMHKDVLLPVCSLY